MITFVYTYYENPGMLAYQYATWANYDPLVKAQIKVLIVDDASPNWPAEFVQQVPGLPELAIYRVLHDMPWHQDGARNLGADRCDTTWMFVSDIDHIVPEDTAIAMLHAVNEDPDRFFTFARRDINGAPNPKRPFNIYLLPKRLYWIAGGYDEDMCGCYGTDGPFRARLLRCAKHVAHDKQIIRCPREVIPDASTTQFERKGAANARKKAQLVQRKIARNRPPIVTLDFLWERAL